MVVTRISRGRGRVPRCTISFDNGESLVVTEETLSRAGVRTGDTLDAADLRRIQADDALASARASAVNYLSYRPRSSREVRDHLTRKGYAEPIARQVVDRLVELRLIDDAAFARMFLRDRLKRGRSGEVLLRQELIGRGIARAIADQALRDTVNPDEQQSAALILARKKLSRARPPRESKAALQARQRLYAYLLRRGFSNDIAQRTVRSLLPG